MRVINKPLLVEYRQRPCEICNWWCSKNSGHHIQTRGANGDDVDDNLLALCFRHHTEIHQIGLVGMITKYPKLKFIIENKNWEFCELQKKWKRLQVG